MRKCLFILLVFCATVHFVRAQSHSNLRKKKIATAGIVSIDSSSLVPGSVSLAGIDSSFYKVDYVDSKIFWVKKTPSDSAEVSYRIFPFKLNSSVSHYNFDSIANKLGVVSPIYEHSPETPLFNFGKIDYNGSFGRSMSFGNNQSAVFNSDFNLQMSGYIGDSIQLRAAITDNNIPIQPEGTTQQLSDFDNILLQFSKKNWEINLGDIDLRADDNYYLNFYKRLEGISYKQKFNAGKNITNTTTVSGAIAKGLFARNVLTVSDGNQGPYRLKGNNNELYFIVLAGTEKVYLDGQLLQRGASQDYTIDYNQAEITFMPRHMITSNSRVQVEFEYAAENYTNYQVYLNNETDFGKKFKLTISAYNNQDSKNSPINQSLDSGSIAFLRNIGDSVQNAFYPIAQKDTFSVSAIMYKKIDTVVNQVHDSVYVYSTDPTNAFYRLSFVAVGANKGNYVQLLNGANGQVFQWVAPVNGVPQGEYEAAQFLVAPKKQQIFSIKGEYQLDSNTLVRAQLAQSNTNPNTFGPKNPDHLGFAGKVEVINNFRFRTKRNKEYTLTTNGSFESESEFFKTIEPLRDVEFDRDWGLQIIPSQASEKYGQLNTMLKDSAGNFLNYKFAAYLRGDGYKGFRNEAASKYTSKNGWNFDEDVKFTSISMPQNKGYYFVPNADISKTFSKLGNYTIGANYYAENNNIRNAAVDSVWASSYAFNTFTAYIKSDPAKRNNWALTYTQRTDKAPFGKDLVQTDHSRNLSLQAELMKNQHQQLRLTATYRQLYVDDTSVLINQQSDKSFLGRLEYFVNVKKGFLTGNLLYDVGSGQEQQMNYTFYEVSAGQGQYTWTDLNNDGIQQLNEFQIAVFSDQATFIKIFTPTNVYIKANYTTLNYSLALNPKMLFDNKKELTRWQKRLSKISFQSSLQSAKKQVADGGPEFNPFDHHVADTALLNLTYIFSNTLSINKFDSKWGIDISRLLNRNKALLTYGSQSTQNDSWSFKGRLNFAKAYTVNFEQRILDNSMITPAFDNQNYAFKTYASIPSFTYTNGTKWRTTFGYNYQTAKNKTEYGGEQMKSNALNFEAKYNAVQNTSITAQFLFTNINYTGDASTTVSYTILQGLLPGKNFQWTLNFTKRLMNNIEINFQYQGRKPGDTKLINIGTASVRAIL
ncbi:MAG: hypothetical protein PW786_13905 [Arachidicoccus sp.]|nr:hypothetical protein [Arachidicoccus sp.]